MYDMYDTFNDILGGKSQKKIYHNTWLHRDGDNNLVIRYHATDIIVISPEDDISLYTGGWLTLTTKERFNRYLPTPFRVAQERGQWYLYNCQTQEEYLFKDGITLTHNGDHHYEVVGAGIETDKAKAASLNRRILAYAKHYVDALLAGEVPAPGPGDCFVCAVGGGVGTEHLYSHLAESYFVPSLLINALNAYPVSVIANATIGALWGAGDKDNIAGWGDIAAQQLRTSITKYLRAQFGLPH